MQCTLQKSVFVKYLVAATLTCLLCCGAGAAAQNLRYSGYDNSCTVMGPLTETEYRRFGKLKLQYLELAGDADIRVLDRPFPRLMTLILASEKNSDFLKYVVQHQSHVDGLWIRQTNVLDSLAIASLIQAKGLRTLQLNCPVSSGADLVAQLQPSIYTLSLNGTGVPLRKPSEVRLPHLRVLSLMNEKIAPDFINAFESTNLKQLYIHDCEVEGSTVVAAMQLPKIRIVRIQLRKGQDRDVLTRDWNIEQLKTQHPSVRLSLY